MCPERAAGQFHAVRRLKQLVQPTTPWWQGAVIYQIYPRSFADATGDGIGDLGGIAAHVDYLQWLGVDAVWLNPIYPSPMRDMGYDVTDFTGVDPRFGTQAELAALIDALHARGIRIILDFVPNHTSDQHPWFLASRRDPRGPYGSHYVWRGDRFAPPPGGLTSIFGGSAWSVDPLRGQHYLHAFLPEQPDLNWEEPAVVQAMQAAMATWFERGVDGFRIDAVTALGKDAYLSGEGSEPRAADLEAFLRTAPPSELVHRVLRGLRQVADAFGERVLVGETCVGHIPGLLPFYGERDQLQLPMNFALMESAPTAAAWRAVLAETEAVLGQARWPCYFLENHDHPRLAARVDAPEMLRLAAVVLLSIRGTPIVYYGQELGLNSPPVPPAAAHDPVGQDGVRFGRDASRRPMPWTQAPGAGFTTGTAWLEIPADYRERAVSVQERRGDSLLQLYRALFALRRARASLRIGQYRELAAGGDVLAYERWHGDERTVVMVNLSARETSLTAAAGEVLLATRAGGLAREGARWRLAGHSAAIIGLA